jgi:DNA-binding helix-hairpin-helix protein with protein kinase domain
VSASGTTAFIDCDSFQVNANGRIYICEVGVPTYTPPELQNRPFKSFQRTQNHDAFGLAVLTFHLLFMGRHPFAGRFSGRGEMPIERAIAECRFPFGHSAQQLQMSPPPNSLALNQIPVPLAEAFEKAFSVSTSKGAARPSSLEWLELLVKAQTDLVQCKVHRAHLYFSRLSNCPWCGIEARGIILFVEIDAQSVSGSHVEDLWKRLAALPSLTPLPEFPTVANRGLKATPTRLNRTRGRNRRIRMATGFALIATVVIILSWAKLDGYLSGTIFVGSILLAYFLPRELQRERSSLKSTLREYQMKYSQIQNNYAAECSEHPFASALGDLGRLRKEHNGLPLQRQRKLQELEQNKYHLQLTQFLDRFKLSDARIVGIGIGRKQMLASYGVDTAADVTALNLSQVPGIGPKFAERLMSWRRTVEPRFRFDPNRAVDRLEIDKIDRNIKSQRIEIENQITKRFNDAVALHGVIAARRKAYIEQALVTLKNLVQMEADYKAS